MQPCAQCGRPTHVWTCYQCGRVLCGKCRCLGCCGEKPALVEDGLLRSAERVEYRLERVRGEARVTAVCARTKKSLRLLSPEVSRRHVDLAPEFDWGNARLPLRWSVEPLPCRPLDYTWRSWTWFRAASRLSKGTEQLAHALLLDFYRNENIALRNYRRFAFGVLLYAPRNAAVVTLRDCVAWHFSHSMRIERLHGVYRGRK